MGHQPSTTRAFRATHALFGSLSFSVLSPLPDTGCQTMFCTLELHSWLFWLPLIIEVRTGLNQSDPVWSSWNQFALVRTGQNRFGTCDRSDTHDGYDMRGKFYKRDRYDTCDKFDMRRQIRHGWQARRVWQMRHAWQVRHTWQLWHMWWIWHARQ